MVYDNPGGRAVWLEDILSLDGASLSATPERATETAENNSQAAKVAMNALVDLVIYIVLIGLVCGLLLWRIDWVPIPEHSHRVARIVVAISVIISVLLYVFYRG
jgi:hypothetical protein